MNEKDFELQNKINKIIKENDMIELAKELNLSESISNIFEDIANGICSCQILRTGEMLKNKKKKLNKYIPKTVIPSIINNELTSILNKIHKSREWQGEIEFTTDGSVIRLIHWEINGDWCIVQFDNNKQQKINKNWFKELYKNKTI